MNKIYLLVVALALLGCKEDEVNPNLISIDLILDDDSEFFSKTVILFSDENYLVKTNFDTYINTYPFGELNGFEELEISARADITVHDTIYISEYIRKKNDSKYILAHHLENGTCLVYDKGSSMIIESVKMEEYREGGPWSTIVGRRFYIGGILFMETADLVS